MTPLCLPLRNMSDGHPTLTRSFAASYYEAARVCLDRHPRSLTEFKVQNGTKRVQVRVEWEETDERAWGAWADEQRGSCRCLREAARQEVFSPRYPGCGLSDIVGTPLPTLSLRGNIR